MKHTPGSLTSDRPLSYPEPPLKNGVVVLRPWHLTDLACIEEASRDVYICEMTTIPAAFSDDEGRAWIQRQSSRVESGEGLSLAVVDPNSDDALGGVFLNARPHAEGTFGVGYWIIERARSRGLASRAVSLIARWALLDANIDRVEALVEPHNLPSQRVVEHAGFKREGYLRSYFRAGSRRADVLVYSLLPGDLS